MIKKLKQLNKKIPSITGAVRTNKYCIWCGKKIKKADFKDALSAREYKISGLCQSCQDETFKE